MESKAAEANDPPPPYSQSTSHDNPNFQQTTANPIQPAANQPSNFSSVPMFVTARTSVYGVHPIEMDCPHCNTHIVTHITRVAGVLPWLIFAALVILGLFLFLLPWCFCCLPFLSDQCLDIIHSCPSCKRQLGRYNRM